VADRVDYIVWFDNPRGTEILRVDERTVQHEQDALVSFSTPLYIVDAMRGGHVIRLPPIPRARCRPATEAEIEAARSAGRLPPALPDEGWPT